MIKTVTLTLTCSLFLLLAHVNSVYSAESDTDMIAAITSGDAVKVAEILSGGADPNSRGQGGITFLMGAAYKGNANIASLLLEKGAKIDEKSDQGMTALMIATYNNRAEVVKLLLDKGCDANIRDGVGNTAFQIAAVPGLRGGCRYAPNTYQRHRPLADQDDDRPS